LAGAIAGGLVALAATRALVPFLYNVRATDPLTYAVVILGALIVSVVAAWIPAHRAAKAQPAELLRVQ
jgi:ABC-type lipoprotein release transport system permease subunit